MLNETIETLLDRAEAKGWMGFEDSKFRELDEHAFDRVDGPSSVITYLEGVVNAAE